MREYLKLLFLIRLFLRLFAFGYPLFLPVMYNFWIFMRLSSWALIAYIAVMGVVELTIALFSGRSWVATLSKVYVALAIVFEFPSSVLELLTNGQTSGYLPFFGWAFLWYSLVSLMAFSLRKEF